MRMQKKEQETQVFWCVKLLKALSYTLIYFTKRAAVVIINKGGEIEHICKLALWLTAHVNRAAAAFSLQGQSDQNEIRLITI